MALAVRKKHKIIGGASLLAFSASLSVAGLFATDTQFRIPTTGTGYNYHVDVNNDGTPDILNQSGPYTHDFGTPGTYTIRISGIFPRIYFNNTGDRLKLLEVN